jgi:AraC-like DNA-binding protein
MKPFVEKLNLNDQNSYYAKTQTTPWFEVGWHQHIELELILFTRGFGTSFIGNYIGSFNEGDIFFLGENLPHTFQKANKNLIVSAVVIQFKKDFWGHGFLLLPECKSIVELLEESLEGLKITGTLKTLLSNLLSNLEHLSGLNRILRLTECLQLIEERREYEKVSTYTIKKCSPHNHERLDKIYQHTLDHFHELITLQQAARIAAMSVPAFCNYFKRSTKKTYIEFLNEVRIDKACKQLIDTEKSINDICRNSGFNTIANFNRQFHKMKLMTPSHYRKIFQNNSVIPSM